MSESCGAILPEGVRCGQMPNEHLHQPPGNCPSGARHHDFLLPPCQHAQHLTALIPQIKTLIAELDRAVKAYEGASR